ncbi:protein MULTIPOLAR SPINDLE 1 [Aristolochia californica]|uniref:protein MULTIPOLAR SPINDLE 1 n=1 Tax=Aristolochia californica TaxID=171875 RepID=UPI0035E2D3EE
MTMATEPQSQQLRHPNPSLKVAIVIALLRSKLNQRPGVSVSESDALRWKRKSKERKQEIHSLQQELLKIRDEPQHDPFTDFASCKCYFFDDLGKPSSPGVQSGSDTSAQQFNDVLHRRFLRQVRWKQRKKNGEHSVRLGNSIGLNGEDERVHLGTAVDFLVELCSTSSQVERVPSFMTLSHQAVEFILDSLRNLLLKSEDNDLIEEFVNSFIGHLFRTMCTPAEIDVPDNSGSYTQIYIQHLLRRLARESYIGQRTLLLACHRIFVAADSLLFMDPFENSFIFLNNCMFMMFQLFEFIISDYMQTWMSTEGFEKNLFEEWVRSFIQSQKALKLLEDRNGLYMIYMERIKGEMVKRFSSVSCGVLPTDVLDSLLN